MHSPAALHPTGLSAPSSQRACPRPAAQPCATRRPTRARRRDSRAPAIPAPARRRWSRAARCPPRAGCCPRRASISARPPTARSSRSTIQLTGSRVAGRGPKFQGRAAAGRTSSASARQQVAGERVQHVLPRRAPRVGCAPAGACPLSTARTPSGSSRSSPQSPPPITLPARAVATRGASAAVKKERR